MDWEISAAEKGGYEHFMFKEIMEQPEALRKTIFPRIRDGRVVLEDLDLTAGVAADAGPAFMSSPAAPPTMWAWWASTPWSGCCACRWRWRWPRSSATATPS